jgi:hypothetical protein
MQFQDRAVDTGGKPKVIGIYDKAAHRVSVSTQPGPPGQFTGFSRNVAALVSFQKGAFALPPCVGG